jgi:hypothetical protein
MPDEAPRELETWGAALRASILGVLVCICFLSRQYGIALYTLVGIAACYASMARDNGAEIELKTSAADVAWMLSICATGVVGTWVLVRLLARWSGA